MICEDFSVNFKAHKWAFAQSVHSHSCSLFPMKEKIKATAYNHCCGSHLAETHMDLIVMCADNLFHNRWDCTSYTTATDMLFFYTLHQLIV